jgi:putative two-component system response regulator
MSAEPVKAAGGGTTQLVTSAGPEQQRPPDSLSDVQTVLVVDDEPSVASYLSRILLREGYAVDIALDGHTALTRVAEQPPDLILLDIVMPDLSGLEICRRLKNEPATRLTPIVLVSGLAEREQRLAGINAGADDFLGKPVDSLEVLSRVRSLLRVKRYTDDLDSAASIMMTIAVMIEAREGMAEGHCHRMANYATAVGRRLGLSSDELQSLHRGGFLHDIGMLAIPSPILSRPGSLEPEEYELIKSHPLIGESLIANLRSLRPIRPIVRHHHERLDGSGYPDALRGDAISVLAQIIGIVDVFEAVTAPRPYQPGKTVQEAVDVLRRQVQRGWRRDDLVESFVQVLNEAFPDTA